MCLICLLKKEKERTRKFRNCFLVFFLSFCLFRNQVDAYILMIYADLIVPLFHMYMVKFRKFWNCFLIWLFFWNWCCFWYIYGVVFVGAHIFNCEMSHCWSEITKSMLKWKGCTKLPMTFRSLGLVVFSVSNVQCFNLSSLIWNIYINTMKLPGSIKHTI